MSNRRDFLKISASIGGALGLSPLVKLPLGATGTFSKPKHPGRAPAPLNILILGGTGFTGPEQVDYAIARGHRVTLFNRGKTRPGVFKGKVAEELIGDLNNDTSALEGKKFDVVIDNPTTLPAWVRNAAKYLAGNTKHYIFISTTSTYSDQSQIGHQREQSDGTDAGRSRSVHARSARRTRGRRHYGALKARAEQEVAKQYPGIMTVIRPCLIVGPLDRTDRFTYWPARIDKGGEVLAPDKPDDPCQFIDSRDLAEWTIRMAEAREFGSLQRDRPGEADDDRRDALRREGRHDVGRAVHVGAVGVPAEAGRASVAHMTVWQPPVWPHRRLSAPKRGEGDREGTHVPAGRRHGQGHARLAQDASRRSRSATLNGEINGLPMAKEAEVLKAWKEFKAQQG